MRKVLLTGFEETNVRLVKMLDEQVESLSFPLQSFSFLDYDESLLKASYDWLILTSRAAVKFYFTEIKELPQIPKVAVVGEATKEAVESFGYPVDFYPKSNASAKDLSKELNEHLSGDESILFPCSKLANDELENLTCQNFQRFEIYEPVLNEKVDLPEFDEVVFLSPSGVEAFVQTYGKEALEGKKIYSLGERTSKSLGTCKFSYEQAEKSSLESLVQLIT